VKFLNSITERQTDKSYETAAPTPPVRAPAAARGTI
jgi:hypothetical protein